MIHKFLLIYTWFIKALLFFLPDAPIFMRFRGFLYSIGMGQCGKNFQVAHNVILNSLEGLFVGDNVYIAMNNVVLAHGNVIIGDNVMIGPNCTITAGNHTFLNGSFRYGERREKAISIKDGCWVGANCVILPGAVLPSCSILGAGAVLTASAETLPSGVYTGIPAKLIKTI